MVRMEEKLVNHCDMELLKMAMLRHEAIFRQQVHELHRLYRVQRQLMSGLPRPSELCRRRQIRLRQPRRALDLRLPTHDYIVITPPSTEDGLELTLAVGGTSRRKRRDESAVTARGCPLGSNCSGGSQTSSSSSDTTASGSPRQRAVSTFHLHEGTTAAAVMKQPQRSPWLVQCLSLKMG